jgi:anti-sigma regulatory factor (Ser/Thr protein kinase)
VTTAAVDTTATANPFVHPALFYRGAHEYLAGTAKFVREGLAAGEPVAVAVPGPNLALLQSELGDAADRVRFLDMTQVGRNPGRIIPGVLRAFADAHLGTRVRIIGEPIWPGRSKTEYPACVQHEALINLAFAGRDVTILCPYDVENLDPLAVADAAATHPVLVDSSGSRTSADYSPAQIVAAYNKPLRPAENAETLAFDMSRLALARRFAAEQATRIGLAKDRIDDLIVAINELTTNSVVHSGGSGVLSIWCDHDYLVCEIHDGGQITDPLAGRTPVDENSTRGRGLLLVNYLSDLVRVHTAAGGTTVQLHFRL